MAFCLDILSQSSSDFDHKLLRLEKYEITSEYRNTLNMEEIQSCEKRLPYIQPCV